jgi:hypothetical protein
MLALKFRNVRVKVAFEEEINHLVWSIDKLMVDIEVRILF